MRSCRVLSLVVVALWVAHPALAAWEWQAGAGFRSAALTVVDGGKPGFTLLLPAQTGIAFTNSLAQERHLTNQILLNGSGVAAGDVDGDGWCDLYFCALDRPNALFRNLGGWKFQEASASAGVACADLDATGAALADLDGDGDLDLIVNSLGGGTHVFQNDGRGRFTRLDALNPGQGGMSLALGDVDGDGFLDLYVTNYRTTALMDMPNTRFWFKTVDGRRVVDRINDRPATDPEFADRFVVGPRGNIEEQGEVDVVFRNVGGTNFAPVPFTGGAFLDEDGQPLRQPPRDWGLSVMFRDLNRDGLPDLYVCNDFDSPDRLWLNQGGGRFRAAPRLMLRQTSLFSMGMDFADLNRDGHDDFVVLDMLNRDRVHRLTTAGDRKPPAYVSGELDNRPQYMHNTLFLNRGDGTFAEIAQLSGVAATDWSWTPAFLDVDLDGYEDLLITNGNERDGRNMDVADRLRALRTQRQMTPLEILHARALFARFDTPNVAFRNRGDLTFEDVSRAWGFAAVGVSHGLALADLDNDGDLDVVVNNLNGLAGVYRNDCPAPRVAVRLKGRPPNTRGIGARLQVEGGAVPQSQEMIAGGRYLSGDDAQRTFAAGAASELIITVNWRSGRQSVFRGAQPNRVYELDEAAAQPAAQPLSAPPPWFEDVSHLIGHTHLDEPFNDFLRQPLLPHQLTQLGPGVSWGDLDGDGWDDLVIGSGKGGRLAAFRNDGRGGFTRLTGPPYDQPVTRDQTTVLAWTRAPGQTVLLAGSANYEDGLSAGSCVRQYDLAGKAVVDMLPGQSSSTGPLALADVDGDGALDLFVGGRVVPGRWPEPASSLMFRQRGGRLVLDEENLRRLEKVGLVSGAVFTDLNADGFPELVLACEWGLLKIFRNDHGRLAAWDPPVAGAGAPLNVGAAGPGAVANAATVPRFHGSTRHELTGWWTAVTSGDFDGDGRLDLVAANWGRNTRYESHRSQPLRLWHGDLDGDGTHDVIEAHFDAGVGQLVTERGLNFLANALPFLRERWTTHESFARAGLGELFGDRLKNARELQAQWLDSTVFLNRGDHFEARPLPVEAQMAPAFGVSVADVDGDGADDVFLGQNFFATQPETPRYDAGLGLWLRGDGRGGFRAVSPGESGVRVFGEQRGVALADYDGDGRVDLAVTQNGAATKLYRNTVARPGVRVRLVGPAGNPQGIGATVRVLAAGQAGPAREVHAGSGYWSQDSAVPVMAVVSSPAQVQVRWPGGKVVTADVPPGAKEITVDATGAVRARR